MESDALLQKLFTAIDAKDVASFSALLTDDAVFRFGSAPGVQGREAVRQAVADFFASVAGLSHVLRRSIVDGATLVCDGEVTYTRHDGRRVTLPFANIFELDGDLIADYRIYADIAPLFAE